LSLYRDENKAKRLKGVLKGVRTEKKQVKFHVQTLPHDELLRRITNLAPDKEVVAA